MATSRASSLPVSLRSAPARSSSFKAASRLRFNEAALGHCKRSSRRQPQQRQYRRRDRCRRPAKSGLVDLAGVMLSAAHQRGEFTMARLRSVRRGSVCSSGSPREIAKPRPNPAMNQLSGTCPRLPRSPDKQGQYLAFIYAYSRIFRQPPAEADDAAASKSRHPARIRWCSPSNALASSGGPRASRAALRFWSSPRTSQSSVELQTVKTSVQRN